jgi:hypothetical protein
MTYENPEVHRYEDQAGHVTAVRVGSREPVTRVYAQTGAVGVLLISSY